MKSGAKQLNQIAQLGTLHKSVAVLAVEPRNMALSVTARKIYNVLIRLSQMMRPGDDGFYRRPLADVISYAGSSTKIAGRIQTYIDQMVQTTVLVHLVSEADARTLQLEGFEAAPEDPDEMREGEERRTFPLLAEVRWSYVGSRHELSWCFPPSIRDMLLSPERWAQIEFTSLVSLSTYTAVALYEILARYKDAPGALSARHSPDWWTRILREGGPDVKLREWRKFKSELLMPAIKEINERTELEVELIEHRQRNSVTEVQFSVSRRRARVEEAAEAAVDVTLPLRAASIGVREDLLEQLVQQYGAMKVAEGLDAVEAVLAKPGAAITRRGDYLKKVLETRFPAGGAGEVDALSPAERRRPAEKAAQTEQLIAEWRRVRLSELEGEFANLRPQEQDEFIEQARAELPTTASVTRRIADREWRSPMIRRAVLAVYASERYGPGWGTPSAAELEEFLRTGGTARPT